MLGQAAAVHQLAKVAAVDNPAACFELYGGYLRAIHNGRVKQNLCAHGEGLDGEGEEKGQAAPLGGANQCDLAKRVQKAGRYSGYPQ